MRRTRQGSGDFLFATRLALEHEVPRHIRVQLGGSREQGLLGVDDDRQMGQLPREWHGVQVERESGGGVEAADATLAEDNLIVAAGQKVLG